MKKHDQFTDRECIDAFLRKVKELKEEELFQHPFNSSLKLSASIETKELKVTWNRPNKSQLRSSWITMRYFFLKKECGYVFRIYNLSQRYLMNETHKKWLLKSREILLARMKSTGIDLNINGIMSSPSFAFDTYINAIFHHDPKCVAFLDGLNEIQKGFFETEMFGFIFDAAKQIFYLANVIEQTIKNNEMKPFPENP
jgi:hypothetical protein